MSFRIEYKYILYQNYIFEFLKNYKQIKKIYPDRFISSVYFDNKKLECHNSSIEGLVPRQKIRIRSYNNENKYFLEKKINSEEGKFKRTKPISETENEKYLNIGMLIPKLGMCNPKIIVSYNRSYYSFDNYRITIDRDINFKKFNSNEKLVLSKCILEIKTDMDNYQNIRKKFPWRHSRFSKYCEGIMTLNIK